MGTVDNSCVLHGLISHMINNNKKLYCSFIELSIMWSDQIYGRN